MARYRVKPPLGSVLNRAGLGNGLVAAIALNEGSGTTAYNAAGGKAVNGTITGSVSWGNGCYGKLLSGFTGGATTNTYIDLSNHTSLNPTAGLSLAALIYPTTLVGANNENWCIGRDDNLLGRSYAFGFGNATGSWFQVNGAVRITGTATASSWIAVNDWNLIVVTADPSNGCKYYAFGANSWGLKATGTWVAPASTTGSTTLGKRTFASNQDGLTGSMAGAWIWNRGLSPAEVYRLAADPFTMLRRRAVPVPLKAAAAAPATSAPQLLLMGVG